MTSPERYQLVVRHGEYNHRSGSLTDRGVEGVRMSARELAHTLGEDAPAVTLVSSSISRAAETAGLIAEELGVNTDENDILFENFLRDDSPEVLVRAEMVARIARRVAARAIGSPDRLIVVTHLPQVVEFAGLGYLSRPAHGVFHRIAED